MPATRQRLRRGQAALTDRWIGAAVDLVAVENGIARKAGRPLRDVFDRITQYFETLGSEPRSDDIAESRRLVVGALRSAWLNALNVANREIIDLLPRWAFRQARMIAGAARQSAVAGLFDHVRAVAFQRRYRARLREGEPVPDRPIVEAVTTGLRITAQDTMGEIFRAVGDFELARWAESSAGQAHFLAFDRAFQANQLQTARLLDDAIDFRMSGDELTERLTALGGQALSDVERIVRTQVQGLAFDTEDMLLRYVGPLVQKVKLVTALDIRVCLVCGNAASAPPKRGVYDVDDPERPELPIHPNCRCTYLPILSAEAGGPELPTDRGGGGELPGIELPDYPEWFERQPMERQRSILGPARYRLYRAGFPIKRFVNHLGRVIAVANLPTLAEWMGRRGK